MADTPRPSPDQPPSMADVAREAGVHKMTVSRVINGYPHVRPELRERILAAAKKLGYRKNKLVATVMSQVARSQEVHYGAPIVILSDHDPSQKMHSIHASLLEAARQHAQQYGFKTEVICYKDGKLSPSRLNDILTARGISALLINISHGDPTVLEFDWHRFAAVTLGNRLKHPRELPLIQSDVAEYMDTCFHALWERGYRRVGVMLNSEHGYELRRPYYASVYFHQKQAPKGCSVIIDETRWEQDPQDFVKWFRSHRMDALLTFNCYTYYWLREAGIAVPEDVGLVCTDLPDRREFGNVSGILHNKSQLARVGIDILVGRLLAGKRGLTEFNEHVLVSHPWHEGKTLPHRH